MNIQDIIKKLGISLNAMQEASADAILNGKDDVIVLSPTGTGKTLAYLLPISQKIQPNQDEVQAIIIVPGRELALQTTNVFEGMKTGLHSYACYGGRPTMDEHRAIRQLKPPDVSMTISTRITSMFLMSNMLSLMNLTNVLRWASVRRCKPFSSVCQDRQGKFSFPPPSLKRWTTWLLTPHILTFGLNKSRFLRV